MIRTQPDIPSVADIAVSEEPPDVDSFFRVQSYSFQVSNDTERNSIRTSTRCPLNGHSFHLHLLCLSYGIIVLSHMATITMDGDIRNSTNWLYSTDVYHDRFRCVPAGFRAVNLLNVRGHFETGFTERCIWGIIPSERTIVLCTSPPVWILLLWQTVRSILLYTTFININLASASKLV